MASPPEYAGILLSKARNDKTALDVLIDNKQVADEIVGFHTQQVVEKALKSVLAFKSIRYRKTHDLAEMIDLLEDNGIMIPSLIAGAVDLTPFAVDFRYDFLPPETGDVKRIDRERLRKLAETAIIWAQSQIATV